LIIEGETPSGFVLNLSDTFRMGYYTQLSDMGQTQLNNELNALKNYLKKNKDSRFIVNITAGESQVINNISSYF
jgi:hypothetical protein